MVSALEWLGLKDSIIYLKMYHKISNIRHTKSKNLNDCRLVLQLSLANPLKQAGKLKIFGTHPNWAVSYIAYTKFHSPRPVFHSPDQIFTHIGERASASFPACWSQESSWEWRCSWSSADRRCSNYIWVINNSIANSGVAYIRGLMVLESNMFPIQKHLSWL